MTTTERSTSPRSFFRSWPSGAGRWATRGFSDDNDRAEYFAPLHLVEGVLDCVEGDGLAHEPVEREPTLEMEIDEHREVTAGQAVAVPTRLEGPAPPEEVDHR